MELGSWSLITAPSLLALIPLIVMIVLVFRGKNNVSGMMVGIILGALMMGQDLGALAKAFSASLGSTTALIGVIRSLVTRGKSESFTVSEIFSLVCC